MIVSVPDKRHEAAVSVVAVDEAVPINGGLGAYLVRTGCLRQDEADNALKIFLDQDGEASFGLLLVRMGMLSDKDLAEAQAACLDVPLIDGRAFPDTMPCEGKVSREFLKKNLSVIVEENDDNLIVAMADPDNHYLLDALKMITGKKVEPRVGIASEIEAAFRQRYSGTGEAESAGSDFSATGAGISGDDVEHLKELASEAPVIKLVNQLIQQAVSQNASDIHIEPFERMLMIRYRVDGVLREVERAPAEIAAAVVSRIKILSNLNIAERRLPQDGRFRLTVRGLRLDLRVSTAPTINGESVVLRLLPSNSTADDFDGLGFTQKQKEDLLSVLSYPHGIVLVTGPTGSGKTTTLYAALNYLNTPEKKILTVEDPVEYNIEGINQIQVKPQIGLTFANALRTIVRQDPDVIMIGEMRDQETASIAVQSALTGHLVLSTLHTNDAAGSITRLLDMGVDDFLLKSTVNAVVAQRLVRTLCNDCKKPYVASDKVEERLHLREIVGDSEITLYSAKGCDKCDGTGFTGRSAIVELIVLDDGLRDLIIGHADSVAIARYARENGSGTMYEDGLRKAATGVTTIEEVLRVTRLD